MRHRLTTFRQVERVDSVILNGPQVWVRDHADALGRLGMTWMQYSADVSPVTTESLQRLNEAGHLDIYIYVPLKYTGGGVCEPIPGSGRIEFRVSAIDGEFKSDGTRIRRHRPTVAWPQPYDVYRDRCAYEYWFKVDRIEQHDGEVGDFMIYQKSRDTFVQCTVSTFAPSHRREIVLASRQR